MPRLIYRETFNRVAVLYMGSPIFFQNELNYYKVELK